MAVGATIAFSSGLALLVVFQSEIMRKLCLLSFGICFGIASIGEENGLGVGAIVSFDGASVAASVRKEDGLVVGVFGIVFIGTSCVTSSV